MLPVLLLVCLVGLGVVVIAATLLAAKGRVEASRQARIRAALYTTRVAEANRVKAVLAAQRPRVAQAAHGPPAGELTGSIGKLDRSTRPARLPSARWV